MSSKTSHPTSPKARSPRRQCHDDACPGGSRNNYYIGKHLTPESYRREQSYSIGRRQLINRAVHGWGVVYGFALAAGESQGAAVLEPGEMAVGEGLALDRLGRELIQAGPATLELDNLLLLGDDLRPIRVEGCDLDDRFEALSPSPEDCWLLSVHYAEQTIDPVVLKDPCNCDRREWDQTCETVVYSLQRIDCDACCTPWTCELRCGDQSPDSPCCADRPDEPAHDHPRGGCQCLCEHLTRLEIGNGRSRLTDVGDCTQADLASGVPLACVRLARDECEDWTISGIFDACGPRRLVKRNDLLFDLINGCDTTRIAETGWGGWHRREQPVDFELFAEALGWTGEGGIDSYPTRDFWVRFSRPVRAATVTADCFAMAVMSDQAGDEWPIHYRVPIRSVETSAEETDPEGYVRRATIVVGGAWLQDAVTDDDSLFLLSDTRIEIEVRGDFIEDCLGQTVSAKPRGRSPYPTGGGEAGGTYLSTFTVGKRRPPPPPEPAPQRSARSRRSTPTAQ